MQQNGNQNTNDQGAQEIGMQSTVLTTPSNTFLHYTKIKKKVMTMGILQMILGSCSLFIHIVTMAVIAPVYFFLYLAGAIFFGVTGCLGIAAGAGNNFCLMVSVIVMSIISVSMFTPWMIVFSFIIMVDTEGAKIVLPVLQVLICATEGVIAIMSTVWSCEAYSGMKRNFSYQYGENMTTQAEMSGYAGNNVYYTQQPVDMQPGATYVQPGQQGVQQQMPQ